MRAGHTRLPACSEVFVIPLMLASRVGRARPIFSTRCSLHRRKYGATKSIRW